MAKKIVNAKDYKTEDIDKLFEKMDRATIAKMTGTGSNLDKKKTKTPAKKKVKRK